MKEFKTYTTCGRCGGDGTLEEDQGNECPRCSGEGYVRVGIVDGAKEIDWIIKKIKKILVKLELPED